MFSRTKHLFLSILGVFLMFIAIVLIYNPLRAWFYCGNYHGFGLHSEWKCWIADRYQDKVLLGHFNQHTQEFKISIETSNNNYFIQTARFKNKLKNNITDNVLKFNHFSPNQIFVNQEVYLIQQVK